MSHRKPKNKIVNWKPAQRESWSNTVAPVKTCKNWSNLQNWSNPQKKSNLQNCTNLQTSNLHRWSNLQKLNKSVKSQIRAANQICNWSNRHVERIVKVLIRGALASNGSCTQIFTDVDGCVRQGSWSTRVVSRDVLLGSDCKSQTRSSGQKTDPNRAQK